MAMAEYLQCGVCFEPYTAGSRLPKFLQCGGGIQHTYCLQCLRRLTVGGMIKCPCCGDLTSLTGASADSLKNNIYLLPQIEAAAAAAGSQARNGLEMFCKTCTAVATEKCGEHDLLKMSELRDEIRDMAGKGATNMDSVKQLRATVVGVLKEAHGVLASVTESVRHNIDDYEMDVQLDDNIVSELERKREAAETLPSDQLVDVYQLVEHDVLDSEAALRDTDALEKHCRALLATFVTLSADRDGLAQSFPVGEWLHSGDLMKALLAASVVVYSLDHASSGAAAGTATIGLTDDCCKATEPAQAIATGKLGNASDAKLSKTYTNGDIGISNSKSSSKSPPSYNGKTSAKSSNSTAGAPVTKAPVTVPDGKGSASSSATNGATTRKAGDSGKSTKTAPASDKLAQSVAVGKVSTTGSTPPVTNTAKPPTAAAAKPATAAAAAAAKPKAAPSFSTMVKSSAPARVAPVVAPEPAGRSPVQRSPRGVNPHYSLRVTNGTSTTDVIIELRPDMAPIMCKNFIMLCDGGHFDNSKFHFAVASDYLLGGRVDDDEGFSPLAKEPEKFVMADQCPLQDECGAIRMKGMGTVTGPSGEKRGLIGSQFMMWVSESREYRQYHYTLVFGFIRQGLDFIRSISNMERPAIWRHARLLSTKPYQK